MIEQQAGQRILMPDGMSARVIMPRGAAALPWWMAAGPAPIAAYQAKGAISYVASKVNLVTPGTYDLGNPLGVVTWDAVNGWQFTASVGVNTRYFTTGIIPGVSISFSVFVQFSAATPPGCLAGCFVLAGLRYLELFPQAAIVTYANNSPLLNKVPAFNAGNLGVAGPAAYRNGVDEGLAFNQAAPGNLPQIFIGSRNTNGASDSYIIANIQAVIIYNVVLNAAQAALIATAMAAL